MKICDLTVHEVLKHFEEIIRGNNWNEPFDLNRAELEQIEKKSKNNYT